MAVLATLSHLSKTFPDNGVRAVDDVSLELNEGEVLALLGENGAGKTTLMALLAGLLAPDEGEVFLASGLSPGLAAGIALVQQHPPFSPELHLWEHAILGLPGRHLEKKEAVVTLNAAVARWGFQLDWHQLCRDAGPLALQKATLTAFFLHPLRLLILDEPTAALGPHEAETLLEGVRAWTRETQACAVFVTHKLAESLGWADRIAVMRSGRLEALTTPAHTSLEHLSQLLFPSGLAATVPEDPLPPVEATLPPVFVARGTRADFSLRAGEILGLTSLRGEGAEDLEEELTGLSPLPEGQLFLGGTDVSQHSIAGLRRLGLSYVPSDRMGRGSSPHSPLASNVIPYQATRLAPGGILRRASVRGYFRSLAKRFSLQGEPGQKLVTLSGGNIQKLILAREMDQGPRVLLLAEPSWGLDLEARRELYRLIRLAARKGSAVVILSSEPQELLEVCTRIGVLRAGRLQGERPTSQWSLESLGRELLGVS
ncbi:MAG: ATP-binding cassette domain-containing protein [Spirochaetales bacterium]